MEKQRQEILDKIQEVFLGDAIEAHVFGSVARGDADPYSDLDVWITFEDEDISKALMQRLEHYAQIGEIIHLCEPPQNSPVNGVHSFVLYKTQSGLLQVDFYLCPKSSSFITKESTILFGDIKLPIGKLTLNPQRTSVPDSYRIDFLITFIFIAIKRLVRRDIDALNQLFSEYANLKDRYGITVEELVDRRNDFVSLKQVITNIAKVANTKQKVALEEITGFIDKVGHVVPSY
jgi:predicted nucleotidyltransferase